MRGPAAVQMRGGQGRANGYNEPSYLHGNHTSEQEYRESMLVKLLKSKLHRGRVTETRLHYPGSIEIDQALMEASGILPYESVLVANLNNGSRLETYAVPAAAGSGKIVILGAAAQLAEPGDIVIVMAFGLLTPEEAATHKPKVLVLDEKNRVIT